jgi:hypothetical protein
MKTKYSVKELEAKKWTPFGGIKENPGVWQWEGCGCKFVSRSPEGFVRVETSGGQPTSFQSEGIIFYGSEEDYRADKNRLASKTTKRRHYAL